MSKSTHCGWCRLLCMILAIIKPERALYFRSWSRWNWFKLTTSCPVELFTVFSINSHKISLKGCEMSNLVRTYKKQSSYTQFCVYLLVFCLIFVSFYEIFDNFTSFGSII